MYVTEIITVDNDILSGQSVFKGTRVSVESLFDHLEAGVPLDGFLDDFPTVSKEQAIALPHIANKLLEKGIDVIYIRDILGHFNIKNTQRYLHVRKEQLVTIVSPLDDLWKREE